MTDDCIANNYEEARQKRLQDNQKRFEDLGILKISKGLSGLTNSEKKSQQRLARPKSKSVHVLEPRRSSRARNPVPSYRDEVDIGLPPLRKRGKLNSSWASYLARPLDEVRTASYEERAHAVKGAEELQRNLQSQNPSFVKSMVRSHVYSCFWLGLPSQFCNDHLPQTVLDMVLENENGAEYDANYIGKRAGLSGGWRAFALDHKLDDGDALVFELIEPTRFKIYIVRAYQYSSQEDDVNVVDKGICDGAKKKASKGAMKLNQNSDSKTKETKKSKAASQKMQLEGGKDDETKLKDVKDTSDNGFVSQKLTKRGRPTKASKSEEKEEIVENGDDSAKKASKGAMKLDQNNDTKTKETKKSKAAPQKMQLECGKDGETKSKDVKDTSDNGFVSQKLTKRGRPTKASKSEKKEEIAENGDDCVVHKSRKRRAAPTRLFRKRV